MDQFPAIPGEVGSPYPLSLRSYTFEDPSWSPKIVDLGQVDFGHLVSAGLPAGLQPTDVVIEPQEGKTYAIWTREGGIALMHVLKVVLVGTRGRINYGMLVDYLFFDWVYYPPAALSPDGTAVQPTSWGAVKHLFRK